MTDGRSRKLWLRRALGAIASVSSGFCAVALAIMALLVTAEVVARSVFSYSFQSTEEISGYCLVAITFLSFAVAIQDSALFRAEFLINRLRGAWRARIEALFYLVFAIVCVLLDYESIRLAANSYASGYKASTLLATPLFIPQTAIPIGLSVAVVFLLAKFCVALGGVRGSSIADSTGRNRP